MNTTKPFDVSTLLAVARSSDAGLVSIIQLLAHNTLEWKQGFNTLLSINESLEQSLANETATRKELRDICLRLDSQVAAQKASIEDLLIDLDETRAKYNALLKPKPKQATRKAS